MHISIHYVYADMHFYASLLYIFVYIIILHIQVCIQKKKVAILGSSEGIAMDNSMDNA